MKKIIFTFITAALGLSLFACGDQGGSNKPANAPSNTASANKAAPAADAAAAEAELKKLVTEYAGSAAKNDIAALDKMTTDNFIFVGNDGSVQTKAERLESMKSGATKYESLIYDDLNVRVNSEGDGAVVIGRAVVKMVNNGKPVEGANRVTQVWSKTKDGWKMASLQATAMTAKSDDDKKAEDKKPDDKMKTDDKAADKAPSSLSNK